MQPSYYAAFAVWITINQSFAVDETTFTCLQTNRKILVFSGRARERNLKFRVFVGQLKGNQSRVWIDFGLQTAKTGLSRSAYFGPTHTFSEVVLC